MVDPGVSWPAEKEAWPGTGGSGFRDVAPAWGPHGKPPRDGGGPSGWPPHPRGGGTPASGRASNSGARPTEGVAPISRQEPRRRYKFLQCISVHAGTGDTSNLVRWTIGTRPIRRG